MPLRDVLLDGNMSLYLELVKHLMELCCSDLMKTPDMISTDFTKVATVFLLCTEPVITE